MFTKNRIVGAIAGLFLCGSSLAVIPLANAETTASTSVISTQELCTWFVDDLPTSVELTNAEAGAEYEGLDFEVSNAPTDNLKVFVSGNLDLGSFAENTGCTWYDTLAIDGIQIDLSVASDDVTSAPDSSLDFSLDTNPYLLSHNQGTCENKKVSGEWSTNDQELQTGASNSPLAQLLQEATSKVLTDNEAVSDRCDLALEFSLTVPGDMTPDSPGAAYTFTLPTVTWTIQTLPLP